MDDSTNAPTEMLVTRRSKRSTAGNRMEAALAEMALDDSNKDMDDDNDFVDDKVEEDIFGSDFESTDEEAEKAAEEAGENEVANEERRIKKAARTRLEKVTAAAHAKHKSSFNPDVQLSTTTKTKPKPKTLSVSADVSMSLWTDAGGESTNQSIYERKRTSNRKHTVLNTSATVTRLKQSEARKASQPKKAKIETKRYSQAELIALALDTEEGNIVEHRDYLKNEAEKRKRARVMRTNVTGPLLRWTSKKEEIKVAVTPPPPPPPPPTLSTIPHASTSLYRSIYGPPGSLFTPTTYSYAGGATMVSTIASISGITPQPATTQTQSSQTTTTPYLPYQPYMDPAFSAFPTWPPTQSPYPSTATITATTQQAPSAQPQQTPTQTDQPSKPLAEPESIPPSEPEFRSETVTKNYVVHELAQQRGTPKATWAETMQAMFGDHVKWDEIKVFTGKGRPLSRPRQTCLITGRQAHYLDPRTGVPYADSYAYKVLTGLLRHEYVWNPSIGCYVDHGEPPPAVLEREELQAGSQEDDPMVVDL
ncbi:YL1 nuclear protein-domain-containing protein [Pholiota molesta]|nr:YL1 nuclear protein-domain-containing protein [Pholiota molesta]